MDDLAGVAARLRVVKEAHRKFLQLWDIEQAFIEPLLDNVVADLNDLSACAGLFDPDGGGGEAADPGPYVDRG